MKSLIEVSGDAAGLMQSINDYLKSIPTWVMGAGLTTAGVIDIGTNFVNNRISLRKHRPNSSFAYLYGVTEQGILKRKKIAELI